ncbi:MAG: rhodanese-like domain-containing protein [Actinomycetota bacterium]|nr:rhodanese-like domain-containing protein [Actinomycetota bacterium]
MAIPYISIESALELVENQGAILLDCRWFLDGRDAHQIFLEGHIPGSRFLDMEVVGADLSVTGNGRHPLPSTHDFAQKLAELGITRDSTLVLYDSDSGTIAARIWWMTRRLSINTYIIAGGIQSYSGPLEAGEVDIERSVIDAGISRWEGSVTTDELINLISKDRTIVILDARNQDRYRGDFEPVDPRAGHIPGAYNLPTRSLMIDGINPAPLEGVKAILKEVVGEDVFTELVNNERQVVVSCGSGITACHLSMFVEEVTGREPILYNGSFSAWSTRYDLPVQIGGERGELPAE